MIQFNQIVELSLNTHEKTDDQKKKTSENMFNSEITDKNSPINAIRRVVTKKKKKIPRPPGISGVIEEDVEGEDEEDGEEEVVEQEQAAVYEDERVHAEMSSEDEAKAKKIALVQKDSKEGKDGKDSKKDKKEKDKKDKKESKKDKEKENQGYKPEDIEKGKKLMANTSFKSNLDRLRQKFKDAGKSGIEESPEITTKKRIDEAPKERALEVKNVKSSLVVEEVDQYGKQSEVILGQKDSGASDLRTSAYGTNTRGMKDMSKGKPLTPEVKFGQPPKLVSEAVSQPKEVTTSEIFEKKKVTITEGPSKALPHKPTYTEDTKPEDSVSFKSSTKAGSSLSKDDQRNAEDWSLKNSETTKPKTKLPIPTLNPKNDLAPGKPPSLLKKKKPEKDDSDNSWDADKNPFE